MHVGRGPFCTDYILFGLPKFLPFLKALPPIFLFTQVGISGIVCWMFVVVSDADRRHEENCLWVTLHRRQQRRLWHTLVYQVQVTFRVFASTF